MPTASAFRTVSRETADAIAGLANPGNGTREETNLPAKESREKSTEEIRVEERRNSIGRWQKI